MFFAKLGIVNPIIALNAVAGFFAVVLVMTHRFLVQYGECSLNVNEGEEKIQVEGGNSLLQSLAQNDIYIPAACGGQGSCGYCQVQVTKGGGPVLPTEEPMLTREELVDDYRLACQVKVREDMEISMPGHWLAIEKYKAKVTSTKELTPLIKEIVLDLLEPEVMDFEPGQYIQVQVPTDGDFEERAYSIASPDHRKDQIALNVQLVEGGLGSTYLHSLEPGDEITFTGPYGDFVIQDSEKDILCLAAGVGLAPFKSMIFSLFDQGEPTKHTVWLLFGARHREDMFHHDEFQNLADQYDNFKYVPVRSVPDEDWDGVTGHNTDHITTYLDEGDDIQAFLCGPPPMMQEALDTLTGELGVDKGDIFYDDFSS